MILRVNRYRIAVPVCLLLCHSCLMIAGCRRNSGGDSAQPEKYSATPVRDINEVLRDHDEELMAIPGVVGVYVGLMPDEKTPCLKVMAARKTPELEKKVPKSLEGYPVLVEETGIISPMTGKK